MHQLQINATVVNPGNTDITNPVFYIIAVSEGTWSVLQNRSVSQIGVISHKDVLDASMQPEVDSVLIDAYYGGNFFTGLKNFGENVLKGVQKAIPYAETAAQVVGPLLPLLAAGKEDKRD